jgi:hypothetical protein|tara:strand:+ start:2291 stop:2725 length:435 start_codon:yes stop_codon:yes gene_type:complete
MALTQTLCTSFKVSLFDGEMDFSADTNNVFKIALFTSTASLDATTTAYSSANEVSGTGYTAGGKTLSIDTNPTSTDTTAYIGFSTVSWPSSTITARGALIYRSSGTGNNAVAVLDFGVDKQTNNSTFTITFPTADKNTAIIRIA